MKCKEEKGKRGGKERLHKKAQHPTCWWDDLQLIHEMINLINLYLYPFVCCFEVILIDIMQTHCADEQCLNVSNDRIGLADCSFSQIFQFAKAVRIFSF